MNVEKIKNKMDKIKKQSNDLANEMMKYLFQ